MKKSYTKGFTLIETMIASVVLSVLALGMYGAIQIAAQSSRMAQAENQIQNNIRDTFPEIAREIEVAARLVTADTVPGLDGVQVFNDGVQMGTDQPGDMVRFQIPLDNSGANWSTPIRYRFVNEDTNGNGLLDAGEDTVSDTDPTQDGNGDGKLTRWIVREQDLDGDGAFDSLGERRVLGGANELQTVLFSLNATGDLLNMTLASQQAINNTGMLVEGEEGGGMEVRTRTIQAQVTTQVYVLN
jgi:prepilin-type N-terminal cleavage/methylation domain-containing protein